MLPYEPKDWCEIVVQAVGIFNDNDICPLATLITRLPGETTDDTLATMELIDDLKGMKLLYVPLFFTSEEDCLLRKSRQADLRHLTDLQWDFIATCWQRNIAIWHPKYRPLYAASSMFGFIFYYV